MNHRATFGRCLPLAFSFISHGVILICLFLFAAPAGEPPDQERIYRVSLEEFHSPGKSASVSSGPLAADSSEKTDAPAPLAGPADNSGQKIEPVQHSIKKSATAQRRNIVPGGQAPLPRPKDSLPPSEETLPGQWPAATKNRGNRGESAASSAASEVSGQAGNFNVYGSEHVDQKPSILRRVTPEYPVDAKNMRMDGTVIVRIVINAGGEPTQCSIHSASPPTYFEEAALAAARKTRFLPGKIKGRPVNTLVLLPFFFRSK
ncbi:MAG: TonB family protein [Desulfovibrio sp.]|jgi:protein TonB|nr:TonB family protein [Desulfovibrio sp.]